MYIIPLLLILLLIGSVVCGGTLYIVYLFRLVVLFLLACVVLCLLGILVFIIVVRGVGYSLYLCYILAICVRGVGLSVLVTLSICL